MLAHVALVLAPSLAVPPRAFDRAGIEFELSPLGARVLVEERELRVLTAAEPLRPGDVVVGVGATRFAEAYVDGVGAEVVARDGPLAELGEAVVDAWGADGTLRLAVERDGALREVAVRLGASGAPGPDFPYDCAWSRAEAERVAAWLAERQRPDGSWPGPECVTALSGLALLSTGDPRHAPALERAARWLLADRAREAADWRAPYRGLFLAEHELVAPNSGVRAALVALVPGDGRATFDPAQPNLHRGLALALAGLLRDLELPVPARFVGRTRVELDRSTGAAGFVTRGRADDPEPDHLHEHAPTAAAVLGFAATSTPEELVFDHRYVNTGATDLADHPHWLPHATASPGAALHLAALATARTDPQALRRLAEVLRPRLALSRRPEGRYLAQPARPGLAIDAGEAAGAWTTASVLLLLTAPRGELRLHGRPVRGR